MGYQYFYDNNMKTVLFASAALAVLMSNPAIGADKKLKPGAAQPALVAAKQVPNQEAGLSPEEIKAQLEYVDSLGKSLQSCQSHYKGLMVMLDATIDMRVVTEEMGLRGRAMNPMARKNLELDAAAEAKIPEAVARCIERGNTETAESARPFFRGFKNEKHKIKAKEAVAQWMTAFGASGTDDFNHESNKFKTLASSLKIDLTLD
jgi:hypothetical protein